MFEVNVKDALEALKNRFGALNAQQVALGTARGLNRAAAKGKTAANRSIREQYNIKARDVNKGLSTKLATRQTLESQIIAQGAGMPLGYFSPKRTPTGISVSIMKGERTTIQRAFFLPTRPSLVVARGNYEGGGSFAFRTKRTRRFGNDLPIAKMPFAVDSWNWGDCISLYEFRPWRLPELSFRYV